MARFSVQFRAGAEKQLKKRRPSKVLTRGACASLMARLTKNCSYGHRDLLSSFPKRPYFLSSGEWTLRNNFSRASWFIRVLSAHSRTRVWGRDLPVTPVILRNKGFPCITSMIIPSPSSHCLLGRCRLPGHEIEPARVSPGLLLIHPL